MLATLFIISTTFFFAGFTKGVLGLGLPTIVMGALPLIMPAPAAAALLIVPSLLTNTWQAFSGGRLHLLVTRLWGALLLALVGTILAAPILVLDTRWTAKALGAVLVLHALLNLFGLRTKISPTAEGVVGLMAGLATGVVTGATGIAVVPIAAFLHSIRLSRDELVQALGLFFSVTTLALATGLLISSHFSVHDLLLSSALLLPTLVGMRVGMMLRKRIDTQIFGKAFLVGLLMLGLTFLLQ